MSIYISNENGELEKIAGDTATLYDTTGQNSDGAMSQKATTDAIQNSVPQNIAVTDKNNNFSTAQTFNGDITINGNITQIGETYETHAEEVFTKNDKITLRDGATGGLVDGNTTGIIAKKYDGTNDGELVFDNTGTARVGDVGDTQPLATRSEITDLSDGEIMTWDAIGQRLIGQSGNIVKILEANENNVFELTDNAEQGYYIAKDGTKITTKGVVRATITGDTPVLITNTQITHRNLIYIDNTAGNITLKCVTTGSVVISPVNLSILSTRTTAETISGVKTFSAQPLMTATLAEGDSSTKIPNTQWVQNELNSVKRNIGEIVTSTIPLVDAGLHILDGAEIDGAGENKEFVDYIASLVPSNPELFIEPSEWQAQVTEYGICGKFVYDATTNRLRLPKYGNKAYVGEDGLHPVFGNGKVLAFTDGTNIGSLGAPSESTYARTVMTRNSNVPVGTTGVSNVIITGKTFGVITKEQTQDIGSDATGIYGDLSDKLVDCYYYIVTSNKTKTEIEVNIDNIATDLNGKADVDLSNCTRPHIIDTYQSTDGFTWYRVWSDGFKECGGLATGTIFTITMPVEFSNTSYVVTLTYNNTTSTLDVGFNNMSAYNKTTTSFTIRNAESTSFTRMWSACGY